MDFENINKENTDNHNSPDEFIDVTSKEIFILELSRLIKNEKDKIKVIQSLRRLDYDTDGAKRDYFTKLEEEVKKFEIK